MHTEMYVYRYEIIYYSVYLTGPPPSPPSLFTAVRSEKHTLSYQNSPTGFRDRLLLVPLQHTEGGECEYEEQYEGQC